MRSFLKPFFINSNLCMDNSDILTPEKFMSSIAGNIGNSYITYSLIKTLFGGLVKINHIQNIYEYDFSKQAADIDCINNECTHCFLILQDQIRISESYGLTLPYENIINFIKKLNKPIIIAGLGSNSFTGYEADFHKKLNKGLISFLKDIAEHTETIGIRGHYTQEVLSKIGINNTQVIGCPSFYEMGRDRILNKKEFSKDLKLVLSNQIPNKLIKNKDIILQDEHNIINAIAFNSINYFSFNIDQLQTLKQKKFHIFSDIESWKKLLSNFDFMMGSRVHGSIIAINSGVCPVIYNVDTRAREMSEFLKIPYHPEFLFQTDVEKIYNACDYDKMNKSYPALYDNYVDFLNKNGLCIFDKNSSADYNYIKQPSLTLSGYNFCLGQILIILKKIFSIKKEYNQEYNHRVFIILGVKIKLRRRKK